MRKTAINGVILTMLLGTALEAATETGKGRLNLRLVVFVPGISSSVDTMKQTVEKIFARSVIEVSWVECVRNGKAIGDSQCIAPRAANEVYIRIVPGEAGEESLLDGRTLGFATPAGSLVTLFYGAAEKLSGSGRANTGQVLGYAAAHELGHIILGAGAHTGQGLMQARWTKKTATEMLYGRLSFSNRQIELLKAACMKRDGRAGPASRPRPCLLTTSETSPG